MTDTDSPIAPPIALDAMVAYNESVAALDRASSLLAQVYREHPEQTVYLDRMSTLHHHAADTWSMLTTRLDVRRGAESATVPYPHYASAAAFYAASTTVLEATEALANSFAISATDLSSSPEHTLRVHRQRALHWLATLDALESTYLKKDATS